MAHSYLKYLHTTALCSPLPCSGEIQRLSYIRLTVKNWSKWNRKVDKKVHWHVVSDNINRDPDIINLTAKEKLLWHELLCLRSKAQNDMFDIDPVDIYKVVGLRRKNLIRAVITLAGKGILYIDGISNDIRNQFEIILNDIRNQLEFNFNSIRIPLQLHSNAFQEDLTTYTTIQNNTEHNSNAREEKTPKPTYRIASQEESPQMPDLIKLWNDVCGKVYKPILHPGYDMTAHLVERWREHPDTELWRTAFGRLTDESNFWFSKGPWRPSLDWLVRGSDKNLMKAFNGEFVGGDKPEEKDTRVWL